MNRDLFTSDLDVQFGCLFWYQVIVIEKVHQFNPVLYVHFSVNIRNMPLQRILSYVQFRCDIFIAATGDYMLNDVNFSFADPVKGFKLADLL